MIVYLCQINVIHVAVSGSHDSRLTGAERVQAIVLQELPFVFPFKRRAEIFIKLVEVRTYSYNF